MKIRAATPADAVEIAAIYNFYVENTHHTFEIEKISVSKMQQRIFETLENYPFLICEENDEVVGYAFAARYKSRAAYLHSVETSVYVKDGCSGKGAGSRLYESLFEDLKRLPVHAIIAGIALPNDASIRLHEKFGFEKVAHFREVGRKFGRWIDVGYWEKINLN
jgi:L-amino acid N-acyltransferase YncA